MNNRQLAIQELFEGLIMKYGGNPNTKKIITAEIQRFSQNKAKITVQDIEKLEEDIKKLCGFGNSPKPRTKISLSTNDKYLLADTSSDTEKRILPAASPMQTSPYIFPFTAKGKKIVKKAQDHILFPNDSSFYDFSIDSVDSQQTSPVKAKLTGNDEWGNIVKADHLKYLNEEKIKKIQLKNEQSTYRKLLFDQIKGKKKKNSNEIFVENPNSLYVTKNEPRKSYDEKKWLDEIIKKKKETTEIKLRNKVIEHQEMKMRWNSEEEAAVNKQKENRKRRKEFAKEQFLQASVMKKTNHLIKELEKQHNRVLIEERIRKLDETETRKVEMVSNRIKFVHDEERLKKLVIPNQLPQNTMKKAEVEYKDGLVEETSPRTKKKNEEYLLLLQKQMEEKKKRDLEYSKVQEEQGKIWYDQDVKAHKEDYQKKVLKLKAQRSLHEEYTQNVQEKQKKRLESSLLSPCEVEINKKILESSIAILESNSPLGSFC